MAIFYTIGWIVISVISRKIIEYLDINNLTDCTLGIGINGNTYAYEGFLTLLMPILLPFAIVISVFSLFGKMLD